MSNDNTLCMVVCVCVLVSKYLYVLSGKCGRGICGCLCRCGLCLHQLYTCSNYMYFCMHMYMYMYMLHVHVHVCELLLT